jgi:hypothetical protein
MTPPPSQAEGAVRLPRVDAFLAALDEPAGTTWSRYSNRLDRLVIAITIGLAMLTLWFASAPVVSTARFSVLAVLWPLTGIAWAISLIGSVQRGPSLGAAILLLFGAGATIFGSTPMVLILLFGAGAAVAGLVAGLGLFGLILVLERPRRIAWVVAPAIVLTTVGLAFSGVPRVARFALAEPALTAFAVDLLEGTSGAAPGERRGVWVGVLRVRRVFVRDGCAHLVTANVGILGDSPAGLAYCPNGPSGGRFPSEPFSGHWYRW